MLQFTYIQILLFCLSYNLVGAIEVTLNPFPHDYGKLKREIQMQSKKWKFHSHALSQYIGFQFSHPRREQRLIRVSFGPSKRENCIVSYASFNFNYPQKLFAKIDKLNEWNFQGDYLFLIGGWPASSKEDFKLAFAPYAHKIAMLKLAKAMGYKNVMWLDVKIIPNSDLNHYFSMISKNGTFLLRNQHSLGEMKQYEGPNVPHCTSCIIGLNFENEQANQVLDLWEKMARQVVPFICISPEEAPLSICVDKAGCNFDGYRDKFLGTNFLRD